MHWYFLEILSQNYFISGTSWKSSVQQKSRITRSSSASFNNSHCDWHLKSDCHCSLKYSIENYFLQHHQQLPGISNIINNWVVTSVIKRMCQLRKYLWLWSSVFEILSSWLLWVKYFLIGDHAPVSQVLQPTDSDSLFPWLTLLSTTTTTWSTATAASSLHHPVPSVSELCVTPSSHSSSHASTTTAGGPGPGEEHADTAAGAADQGAAEPAAAGQTPGGQSAAVTWTRVTCWTGNSSLPRWHGADPPQLEASAGAVWLVLWFPVLAAVSADVVSIRTRNIPGERLSGSSLPLQSVSAAAGLSRSHKCTHRLPQGSLLPGRWWAYLGSDAQVWQYWILDQLLCESGAEWGVWRARLSQVSGREAVSQVSTLQVSSITGSLC